MSDNPWKDRVLRDLGYTPQGYGDEELILKMVKVHGIKGTKYLLDKERKAQKEK